MADAYLTPDSDVYVGDGGDNTVQGTSVTLTPGDSLDGGLGNDALNLIGDGVFDLTALAQFDGFEEVNLTNFTGGSSSLLLTDSFSGTVNVDNPTSGGGSIYLGAGSVSVDLATSSNYTIYGSSGTSVIDAHGTNQTMYLGSGDTTINLGGTNFSLDRIYLGSGTSTVNWNGIDGYVYLSDAQATINIAGYGAHIWINNPDTVNAANVYNNASGNEAYFFVGGSGQELDLTASTVTGSWQIYFLESNVTVNVDSNLLTYLTAIHGNGFNDIVHTSDASLDLTNTSVTGDVSIVSTNSAGTTFTVADAQTAFRIAGGAGDDTIIAQGLIFTAAERSSIFASGSIETIQDDSGTYSLANNILTPDSDVYVGDGGDNTVQGTSVTLTPGDSLDGGLGNDALNLIGDGVFDLTALAQFDGFEEVNLTNFTGGSSSLLLTDSFSGTVNVDNPTSGGGSIYLGAGSVSVDLATSSNYTIYGSSGTSVIDAHGTNQTMYLGSGDTTINLGGTNFSLDRIYLGSGTSTVNWNGIDGYVYLSDAQATINIAGYGAHIWINNPDTVNAANVYNNASGNEAYFFVGGSGQELDLTASTVTGSWQIYFLNGNVTVDIDNNLASHISWINGNGYSQITVTTGEATLDLTHMPVTAGVSVISTNTGGTTFLTADAITGLSVAGGAGEDTLIGQGFAFTASQRTSIFALGSIETIQDDSGTYNSDDPVLISSSGNYSYSNNEILVDGVELDVSIAGTNDQITIEGNTNSVTVGTYYDNADFNTVYVDGYNNSLSFIGGFGNSIHLGGDESELFVAGFYNNVFITGTNGQSAIYGYGHTIEISSSNTSQVLYAYQDVINVSGSNVDIAIIADANPGNPPGNNTINVSGTGNSLEIVGSNTVNFTAPDGALELASDFTTVNLLGYSAEITLRGYGNAFYSSSEDAVIYSEGVGLSCFLSESSTTITSDGWNCYFTLGSGATTLNINQYGNWIYVATGQVTVNFSGDAWGFVAIDNPDAMSAGNVLNGFSSNENYLRVGGSGQTLDTTSMMFTADWILQLQADSVTVVVDDNSISNLSHIIAEYVSGGVVRTNSSNLDLRNTQVVGGVQVISANLSGTIFSVSDVETALHVVGGAGHDTLIGEGISFSQSQLQAIFAQGSIELVEDINGTYFGFSSPSEIYIDTSSIDENSTPQTLVGVLTADDPDAGDTATFTLLDNAGGLFEIVNGNELVLADGAVLDFESAGSHSVTVRVTDSAGLYLDQTFSIDVNDLNEEPSSLTFTGDTVSEAAAEGDVVGVLNAADPDAGDTLTYTLMDDAGGLFVLDGNQVKVATGASFDFETADSHTISVDVTDAGGLIRSETFVITLGDVNEAPDSLTITGSEVEENAAAGTVVSSLDATDPDTGDTLSFSLSDDAGGRFVVVGNEVQVADGASLDFEDQNSHDITVVVTDSLGLTRSETVTITVANVDEAPTDLTISATEVDENAAAGSVVATLTAIDPDGADGLAFALVDDAGGLFDIQNDQILVAAGALIDFETQSSHDITVEVTDPSGLSYQKTFTITVIDSNEAPTDIVVTGGTVLENAAEGTVVATLSAVDQDIGETLTYAIADTSGLFEIVDNQIRVAAGAAIDYETQTSHGVTVSVTDSAGNSYEEELTIVVQNVSGNIIGTNAANTLNGTSEEDFIDGRGGNDTMSGADGNDQILGGAGNDRLIGGLGADTLIGGLNDDTYVLSGNDVLEDTIVEDPGQGTDTVETDQSYTLGANLEKLVLTGTSSINGTGNALANTLTGNSGDNILDGAAGSDTMIGGAGSDIYYVDAGDIVTEGNTVGTDEVRTALSAYTLGTNIENLTYIGSGSFTGTGNTAANTMTGGSGADSLDGGSGNDTMIGLGGNDTYIVAQTGDQVVEAFNGGIDTVNAAITYALAANVEKLVLTGTGSINGTGNDLANTITGNSGANVLNGGLGVDTLSGGTGNDTYVIDDLGDSVVENVASGTDIVRTSLLSYVLDANVENLTFTGIGNFSGTGNALVNTITGGSGDDTLDGGAGVDRLIGGAGNDTYIVDASTETITEGSGAGIDTVIASVTMALAANVENLTLVTTAAINGTGNGLNNVITGNSAANTLSGAAGIDRLIGGGGNDILNGGTGNDVFVFASGFGNDTIQDFDYNPSGGQDLIDLSGFGITAATFASRVILADLGADIRLTIDGNAAQTITLTGAQNISNITVADFVL